jgi:hypothetical protein
MPRYKDSFTDEHFMAKLETTSKEPVLHLALRHPGIPYAIALDGWPDVKIVVEIHNQICNRPKDRWYPVSIRACYRKHSIEWVEVIDPIE